MADGELKAHALNSSQDFYELLGVGESASENEIRRAWRKSALKYHPDKVGPSNTEALDKFHLLQIAQDVLCDPGVRELYDNARRAREDKRQREAAYNGRRKWMKEDLERRESGALKRKRDELDVEEKFEQELSRLAEDGKRRRKERKEQLRKEALEQDDGKDRGGEPESNNGAADASSTGTPDVDRSLTLRFKTDPSTAHLDRHRIISLFERFGPVEDAILRDKKVKAEGEKHRVSYVTAVLVFKSIVGAHAAISDFEKLCKDDPITWSMFEQVGWASGKEPKYIPRARPRTPVKNKSAVFDAPAAGPSTPLTSGDGLKRVPSFASFKGTPGGTPRAPNTPAGDEIMMMRLKNAEKRRVEEKIRQEEAAAAAAETKV